jgi:hypothetical protein
MGEVFMLNRKTVFESYATHHWLKKSYKRLSTDEISAAHAFIADNAALSRAEFELAINRMFMFRDKPKNWTTIVELLTCANSGASEQCDCCRLPMNECDCLGPPSLQGSAAI